MNREAQQELLFGATLQGIQAPVVFQEQVRELEEAGFSYLWVTDSSLHARYVYAYLTLAAINSKCLKLGTGITHPYTRHPGITASAIATLDEISGGRAVLGVGAGDRPTAELGYAPARVQVLREMVMVIRRLMAGERLDHKGAAFNLVGAELRYRYRDQIPIFIACSGPRMLALAGEVADGVIVQCGLFPEAIEFALECIAKGAKKARRSLDEIDIWLMACGRISEDRAEALDSSRSMAAWFAQTASHYCEVAGFDPEIIRNIQDAYQGGEFHLAKDAAALVSDEMVELFTIAGTPKESRERIEPLLMDGVRGINFMPIGPDRFQSSRLFAQWVVQPLMSAPRI